MVEVDGVFAPDLGDGESAPAAAEEEISLPRRSRFRPRGEVDLDSIVRGVVVPEACEVLLGRWDWMRVAGLGDECSLVMVVHVIENGRVCGLTAVLMASRCGMGGSFCVVSLDML